jgi:hypothetical protein
MNKAEAEQRQNLSLYSLLVTIVISNLVFFLYIVPFS